MRVYVGQSRGETMNAILDENKFGEMTVRGEFPPRRIPWAFDNGAFRDFTAGDEFQVAKYEASLEKIAKDGMRPDFIVVPDIVGGGLPSLDLSMRWVDKLRPFGPLALAVQNGMTVEDVRPMLGAFSYIFVGGNHWWKKRTAPDWIRLACEMRIRCHIGRVGTPGRVRWARMLGADSIDSCFPLWTFDRMDEFVKAVNGPIHLSGGLFP